MKTMIVDEIEYTVPELQGDIAFAEIAEIPSDATPMPATDGRLIVAHSETGHHHYVDAMHARGFDDPKDRNICYLQALSDANVIHDRGWDTHAPRRLDAGRCYIGIRQVERAPAGWRRVAD